MVIQRFVRARNSRERRIHAAAQLRIRLMEAIRMVAARQRVISGLHFIGLGTAPDAQHFVMIRCCRKLSKELLYVIRLSFLCCLHR